jgi:hypothetical protein
MARAWRRTGSPHGPADAWHRQAALGVLSARDMLLPARLIKRGPDQTTLAALAAAGISGGLTEQFFRPFLAGVFLEDDLETSSRFFHLVWRSMLRGTLCLPRRGIQAVPEQLIGQPARSREHWPRAPERPARCWRTLTKARRGRRNAWRLSPRSGTGPAADR